MSKYKTSITYKKVLKDKDLDAPKIVKQKEQNIRQKEQKEHHTARTNIQPRRKKSKKNLYTN